jgi:hypothetical protein
LNSNNTRRDNNDRYLRSYMRFYSDTTHSSIGLHLLQYQSLPISAETFA